MTAKAKVSTAKKGEGKDNLRKKALEPKKIPPSPIYGLGGEGYGEGNLRGNAPRQCRQLIFAQIAIHLICTAAKNDDVFLAYLVAMPRQRFSSRNAFSTKCRRL